MQLSVNHFIRELNLMAEETGDAIPKSMIFGLAKRYLLLPVSEVVLLIRNENHDYRVGAVAILDWKARSNKTSDDERREIFSAYIENHNWIDDWGLVDRAAPYVVGGYLFDKDRTILYELAKSANPMERRTAIVSTYYFLRKKQTADTFALAEILINDKDIYVQKAVGSWLREAGKYDFRRLKIFLDKYAEVMPRITLQYSIEKLDEATRNIYRNAKKRLEGHISGKSMPHENL